MPNPQRPSHVQSLPRGPRACAALSSASLLRPHVTAPLWPPLVRRQCLSHISLPDASSPSQGSSSFSRQMLPPVLPTLPLCSGHAAGPSSAGAHGRVSLRHIRSFRLETVRVHIPPTEAAHTPLMTEGAVSEGTLPEKGNLFHIQVTELGTEHRGSCRVARVTKSWCAASSHGPLEPPLPLKYKKD